MFGVGRSFRMIQREEEEEKERKTSVLRQTQNNGECVSTGKGKSYKSAKPREMTVLHWPFVLWIRGRERERLNLDGKERDIRRYLKCAGIWFFVNKN